MNLKNKIKLNQHLRKKDWISIKKLMKEVNFVKLGWNTKKEIILLALQFGEQNLSYDYIISLKDSERKEIFNQYYTNLLYITNNALFERFLSEFLEIGLKTHNQNILYHLAKICSSNINKYTNEIAILNAYFKNEEVNDTFIAIANLEGFHCEELDDMIIHSGLNNIINYLWYRKKEYNLALLTKYFKKTTNEEIMILARETIQDDLLYQSIIEVILTLNDSHLVSQYLYIMYQENPKYPYKMELVKSILNLEQIDIIVQLIQTLSEKEQDQLAKEYLENKNDKMIFYLACTTNCSFSYQLIDYVLKKDQFEEIVMLLSNLNTHHLTYALNKIIKGKDTHYYLNLIDHLYLFHLPNFIEAIDYIFNHKLEKLFTEEETNRLKGFLKEEVDRKVL